MLIIACISLLALMLLGVPITFSLLGAGFLAVLLGDGGLPMYMNCRGFISGVNSFTLMAIPFFMISGSIMNQGGLSSASSSSARPCSPGCAAASASSALRRT